MSDLMQQPATHDTTRYEIKLFLDSSVATAGHRLSVIRWKKPKTPPANYKPKPAYCISIPEVDIIVEPEEMQKALQQSFQDLQDDLVREMIEAWLAGERKENTIAGIELNTTAVSSYYDRVATNGRLSTVGIENWFDSNLAERLADALLTAVPALAQEPDKLAGALQGHKDALAQLASPRAMMQEKKASQLLRAVNIADDDGKVKPALISKLNAFLAPAPVIDLGISL